LSPSVALATTLLLASFSVLAAPVKLLKAPPETLGPSSSWTAVEEAGFYEVSASRVEQALEWLGKKDSLVLEKEKPSDVFFQSADVSCRAPNKIILLRANYINGATGKFSLYWAGKALVVEHAFLGPQQVVHQTAIVACLPRQPAAVHALMPGAL